MIPVTYAERIHAPKWPAPQCECSDCRRDPTSSHGIYTVGAYTVPAVLSRRGNHVTPAHIEWQFANESGNVIRGRSVEVIGVLDNKDERAWFI